MGFLTGKYTRENSKPEGCRLSRGGLFSTDLLENEQCYTIVDQVIHLAEKYHAKPSQVAIAWLISKNYVSTVIIGASSIEQLQENLASMALNLSDEDIKLLDDTFKPYTLYPNMLYHNMMDPIYASMQKSS